MVWQRNQLAVYGVVGHQFGKILLSVGEIRIQAEGIFGHHCRPDHIDGKYVWGVGRALKEVAPQSQLIDCPLWSRKVLYPDAGFTSEVLLLMKAPGYEFLVQPTRIKQRDGDRNGLTRRLLAAFEARDEESDAEPGADQPLRRAEMEGAHLVSNCLERKPDRPAVVPRKAGQILRRFYHRNPVPRHEVVLGAACGVADQE